ncbi:hypothetical protein D9619_012500 [Psilocybe cf. subviscida]|uniref:hAT-like transposase RNase-H fold domain-containing protein n=1 Tax=Psilocybe cf. subviscida TaxID=2480587 RepID=A0A8H5B6K7_9AGAR|nr:hypothetical protein D9619_012500 [Psilocybe cf. subviscida]
MGLEEAYKAFSERVNLLKILTKSIPHQALRCATTSDRITQVFDTVKIPESNDERWKVFNKRMDALFGEDVCDSGTGRLLNLLRGEHGMDLVLKYFDAELKAGVLPWDLAKIKINRLIDEVMAIKQAHTQKSKKVSLIVAVEDEDDSDDADYHPPKRQRDEPPSPSRVFDSEGEEVDEENNCAVEMRDKREKKKARKSNSGTAEDDAVSEKQGKKVPAKKKPACLDDIESGTLFVVVRTVERTLKGKDTAFSDEPILPKLSNLASHLAMCKGKDVDGDIDGDEAHQPLKFNYQRSVDLMGEYLRAGNLNPAIEANQDGFYGLFAAWVLDESLPWTTGEAPALSLLFKYLRVHFTTPSDTTVCAYLSKIYQELHAKVVQEIAGLKSKIAYATDTWTTRQMVYSFACSIAAWIDSDWNLVTRVVDFKALKDKEHEGVDGGLAFVNGSLTTDNASVNDVLVDTVAKRLLERYGVPYTPDCHIRCFAHITNLVVQSFLASMDEAPDPDDDDEYADITDYPLHYDVDADEEQIALESEKLDKSILNSPEFADFD